MKSSTAKLWQYIIFGTWVVIALLDILFTTFAYFKHDLFNETNPIWLMTNSLGLLWLIKIFAICFYAYVLFWFYKKIEIEFFRYAIAMVLMVSFFGQGYAVIEAYKYWQAPVEVIDPNNQGSAGEIGAAERMQIYKQEYIYPQISFYLIFALTFIVFKIFDRTYKDDDRLL